MLFQSAGFLFLFLPAFLLVFLCMPHGIPRSLTLLIFSYLFYSGAEPLFVLLLVVSSLTDFTAALRLRHTTRTATRRGWLLVSIVVNLGLLAFYKYGSWLLPGLSPALEMIGVPMPHPDFFKSYILPAGISFYTFQSMSYTIDVYRRKVEPERSLLGFCNYVAYLPQLIAGPIERYGHLYPQLRELIHGRVVYQWSAGLDRIVLGVAQKLLIADSCGLIVDRLLTMSDQHSFVSAWAIAIGFGMQIYYDFAAYTHIAIGISLILGVRLEENFNSPYRATSIQDFWRRWHMTLSRWFRDYLYIPLGGSRCGEARTCLNILVTFLLVGLWHGAGWNYIAWGVLHGTALAAYHLKKSLFPKWIVNRYLALFTTFAMVHVFWVPFRVDDSFQIVQLWSAMFGASGFDSGMVSVADLFFLTVVTIATLVLPNAASRWPGYSGWIESAGIAAIAVIALVNTPEVKTFIYFQF